jgi:hypothetical protein
MTITAAQLCQILRAKQFFENGDQELFAVFQQPDQNM